jgi:hypothetical protein
MAKVVKLPEKSSHFQVGDKDGHIVCGCSNCDYYLYENDMVPVQAIHSSRPKGFHVADIVNNILVFNSYQCRKCKSITLDLRDI